MLKGKQITVRPMRNEDIGPFHEKSLDLESRGPWYPLPGTSLAAFEKAFAESGFWTPDSGIFAIIDQTGRDTRCLRQRKASAQLLPLARLRAMYALAGS